MTDINKRFAELAGIAYPTDDPWQQFYQGTVCIPKEDIPKIDYTSDPLAVLWVMREKLDDPDWVRFVDHIGEAINWPKDGPSVRDMVRIDLILTPGAMVKAAVDYLANVQLNDGKS